MTSNHLFFNAKSSLVLRQQRHIHVVKTSQNKTFMLSRSFKTKVSICTQDDRGLKVASNPHLWFLSHLVEKC